MCCAAVYIRPSCTPTESVPDQDLRTTLWEATCFPSCIFHPYIG